MYRAIPRLVLSAALSTALVAVCVWLPHVNDTTAALLMVLWILGISIKWGWAESLSAAIVGGIAYDYYFLGPTGFSITSLEYGFALAAFVITAVATGQMAARLKRRQTEMEQLYRIGSALLESSVESTPAQLAQALGEVFGADGVALYDHYSGQIVRFGPSSGAISDEALREAAASGRQVLGTGPRLLLARIPADGELKGSFGMSGVRLSASMLRAVAGRIALALTKLYAIQKTAEAEFVRRSDELKSAVLDAVAHEIRNPLNSIRIAATTLLSDHPGSEMFKREMLTVINEEVIRMDRSLDEAVQIAHMEASDLFIKKEPQDLARLIPAAIEEMHALAGRRPIHVSVPESLPPAECDRDMIARVLKQLLSNALKYSPEGSPLAVSAECTGAAVVIDVVDRGPGVDDEERDRIFEKYYRGRASRSGPPGTGLGLASARSIIQAHGGEIWITTPPGGGAAFHVSLPVTDASRAVGAT